MNYSLLCCAIYDTIIYNELIEVKNLFFFFFDNQGYNIFEKCLSIYVHDDLKNKFYCDMSNLFADGLKKSQVKESVEIDSKELNELFKNKYPESESDLSILSKIYSDRIMYELIDPQEAFAILFWSFKIFFPRFF